MLQAQQEVAIAAQERLAQERADNIDNLSVVSIGDTKSDVASSSGKSGASLELVTSRATTMGPAASAPHSRYAEPDTSSEDTSSGYESSNLDQQSNKRVPKPDYMPSHSALDSSGNLRSKIRQPLLAKGTTAALMGLGVFLSIRGHCFFSYQAMLVRFSEGSNR